MSESGRQSHNGDTIRLVSVVLALLISALVSAVTEVEPLHIAVIIVSWELIRVASHALLRIKERHHDRPRPPSP